jgi:hypothetical protein
MAESNNDDLADALAQMANGDVAPSEHEPEAPIEPPPVKAVRPASSRPVVVPPASVRPARPVAPVPSNVTLNPPPAAPVAPPVVTTRPVVPVVRKQRPAAPTITQTPGEAEVAGDQSTALSGAMDSSTIIDDDDSVIVPAPDASVFDTTPKKKAAATAKAKAAVRKNLEFRRTMIPILLTCGVLMLGFASLKFVSGSESSLSVLPIWVPVLLVLAGAIVLALAVVNILTVKNQLSSKT